MTNDDSARAILDRLQPEYGHRRHRAATRHDGSEANNPLRVPALRAGLGYSAMPGVVIQMPTHPVTRPIRAQHIVPSVAG